MPKKPKQRAPAKKPRTAPQPTPSIETAAPNGARDSFGLNARQRAFADHYHLHRNATAAYKAAGYHPKDDHVAAVCASDLLRNPDVAAYLDYRAQGLAKHFELTEKRLMAEIAYAALFNPKDLIGEDGKAKRMVDLPDHVARALDAVELDADGRIVKYRTLKDAAQGRAMRYLRLDRDAGGIVIPPANPGEETTVTVKQKRVLSAAESYRVMLEGT